MRSAHQQLQIPTPLGPRQLSLRRSHTGEGKETGDEEGGKKKSLTAENNILDRNQVVERSMLLLRHEVRRTYWYAFSSFTYCFIGMYQLVNAKAVAEKESFVSAAYMNLEAVVLMVQGFLSSALVKHWVCFCFDSFCLKLG